MKVSVNWLGEYIDLSGITVKELSDRLTGAGLEIEGRADTHKIDGIVTAKVLSKEKHPNADKLNLCKVTDGVNEYQIVCGAANVEAGQIVVLAKIGAKLPELTIKEAKIRDILSQGMLCSSSELGIEDNSTGIIMLPHDTEIGLDANDIVGLGDSILELNVTPNRPDWLCVIGVAREVSALFNRRLKLPSVKHEKVKGEFGRYIKIDDADRCPSYHARYIKGVKIAPSPLWMQNRLRSSGLRPINNIVDATNYILLEYNQPLHAFDYDMIAGGITICRAAAGEKIITLDSKERVLDDEMLLISDEKRGLAVAGVMGGLDSSVTDDTENILLEAAYFLPESVRRTSKKLGLSSDASYRYERGIDFGAVSDIADYAAALIQLVAGGEIIDTKAGGEAKKISLADVSSDPENINRFLGTKIKPEQMVSYLNSLAIRSEIKNGKIISTPPTFRIDIEREADIAEEVARLYGFDNIETTIPQLAVDPEELPMNYCFARAAREKLEALGFNETINYSFLSEEYLKLFDSDDTKYVKLLNPISLDMAFMRVLLFPSLLKNLETNWNQSVRSIKLYEISSVYNSLGKEKLAAEKEHIAFAVMGDFLPLHWSKKTGTDNFFYLKGVVENILQSSHADYHFERSSMNSYLHPKRAADIFVESKKIGFIGELHPLITEKLDLKDKIVVAEFEIAALFNDVNDLIRNSYKKFSRFQNSERDMSIVISDSIDSYNILREVKKSDDRIIDVQVFDTYKSDTFGENAKSIAFRVQIADMTKTLEDEEINKIMDSVLKNLETKFSAGLR